jgi:two-component system phosphate regulon response regulator PhoB
MSINAAKEILLVDDDQPIREMLRAALERQSFTVSEADCADKAREFLRRKKPDLMLVDWMMPQEDGISMIKRLRDDEINSDIPVIMLTARIEQSDKVKGLESGADDYLTKPVAINELVARINALLRRTSVANDEKLVTNGLELDLAAHMLHVDGNNVHIGRTEFSLLKFFIEHPNRVYSRSQLLDFVWGQSSYIEERTVDVHILRLRKILKPSGHDKLIKTIRGMGYIFTDGARA